MKHTLITSRSNPWVQQCLRFQAKPAERKAAAWVWLEGEHLLNEALQRLDSRRYAIETLVLPDAPAAHAYLGQLSSQHAPTNDLNIVFLTESVYKLLCSMDSKPKVCAVLRLNGAESPQIINGSLPTVVLDGVQDPGNIGTLIRLCAAFAVPQVLLAKGSASAWSAKALRAGQGAQLAIKVLEDVDLVKAYSGFTQNAVPIAITSLAAQSLPLNQVSMARRMVWVFGNEGQGVSAASQQAATQWVNIPMQGGFESLNVGAAAAICLWQWQQFSL